MKPTSNFITVTSETVPVIPCLTRNLIGFKEIAGQARNDGIVKKMLVRCVGTHSVRPRSQRNAMFLHGRTQFAPTQNNTNRTMPAMTGNKKCRARQPRRAVENRQHCVLNIAGR